MGEREFWQQVAADSNPGWDVRVLTDAPDNGSKLSAADVRLYPFDTKTLWHVGGALHEAGALETVAGFRKVTAHLPDAIISAAGMAIVDAADISAPVGSEATNLAMTMTLLALSHTQTYELARQRTGSIKGHWLYLVYRMKDGHRVGRPAFVSSNEPGLLHPEWHMTTVRRVIATDIENPRGTVGSSIRAHGGLDISPALA